MNLIMENWQMIWLIGFCIVWTVLATVNMERINKSSPGFIWVMNTYAIVWPLLIITLVLTMVKDIIVYIEKKWY